MPTLRSDSLGMTKTQRRRQQRRNIKLRRKHREDARKLKLVLRALQGPDIRFVTVPTGGWKYVEAEFALK